MTHRVLVRITLLCVLLGLPASVPCRGADPVGDPNVRVVDQPLEAQWTSATLEVSQANSAGVQNSAPALTGRTLRLSVEMTLPDLPGLLGVTGSPMELRAVDEQGRVWTDPSSGGFFPSRSGRSLGGGLGGGTMGSSGGSVSYGGGSGGGAPVASVAPWGSGVPGAGPSRRAPHGGKSPWTWGRTGPVPKR